MAFKSLQNKLIKKKLSAYPKTWAELSLQLEKIRKQNKLNKIKKEKAYFRKINEGLTQL